MDASCGSARRRTEAYEEVPMTTEAEAEKEPSTATRRRSDAMVVPPPVLARNTPDGVKAASSAWLASRANVAALIPPVVKLSAEEHAADAAG